ncbi:MAG: peptidylprolyl isomerase [Gammaproteobacteria bacterium]
MRPRPRLFLHWITVFLLSAAGLATAQEGQAPAAPNPDEVLVRVNGKPLTRQELALYTQRRLADRSAQRDAEGKVPNLTRDLVALEVMAQQAEREKLHEEKELQILIDLQRKNLLAQVLMERYLRDNPITEEDLRTAYERVKQRVYGTQYQVFHIQVADESKALELLEQLANGADFSELAREHSTDPSSEKGGELGWFTAEQLPSEIATVVTTLEPRSTATQPVKSSYGWHVVRIGDKREQTAPGFEESRETLRNLVRNDRLQTFVSRLTQAARIETPPGRPSPSQ